MQIVSSGGEEQSANGSTPAPAVCLKKIMWVEDDPMLSYIISKKFATEGCELVHTTTGEEVLSRVETEMPDVIILDIVLPSLNGFEVLEKLKSMPKVASIPVILLSNMNQKDEEEQGLKMGAVKFLVKAEYTPGEIIEIIKGVVLGEKK